MSTGWDWSFCACPVWLGVALNPNAKTAVNAAVTKFMAPPLWASRNPVLIKGTSVASANVFRFT